MFNRGEGAEERGKRKSLIKKLSVNPLTNESESDIIEKLLKKQSDLLGNITEKTFEKKMKKVLDKSEEM